MDTLFDLEPDGDDATVWWHQAWTAIAAEAATGQAFTIAEASHKHGVGEPPHPQSAWGHLTQAMARAGVITPAMLPGGHRAYTRSHRPSSNGSALALWTGAA